MANLRVEFWLFVRTTTLVQVDYELAHIEDQNDEHGTRNQLDGEIRKADVAQDHHCHNYHLNCTKKRHRCEHNYLPDLLNFIRLESSHEGLPRLDFAKLHLPLKLEVKQTVV